MDDFDAPTFSLGIDLDDDEPNKQTDVVVDDSDKEPVADLAFKRSVRRRRLILASSATPSPKSEHQPYIGADCNDEEEIEDFSSQDDDHALRDSTSGNYQAKCSTSKTSLPAQGSVVKSNRKLQSDYQSGTPLQNNSKGETSGDKINLPKLSVSPVRKFQLVDSDSDDFLDNNEVHKGFASKDESLKTARTSYGHIEPSGKRSGKETSTGSYKNDDLWTDFLSTKSLSVSTPTLDEICEEYFQTCKEKNDGKNPEDVRIGSNGKLNGKITDHFVQNHPSLHGSVPPAHHYFFHNDTRIRDLVRSRLHNFFPLDILNNRGDDHLASPNIDYRSQFSHGETSTSRKQPNQKSNVARNSTRGGRKNKSMVEKASQVSESWVNPRAKASISKDAGQRRVQADSSSNGGCPNKASSAGRWFTGSDGKRVYVSSSGKELTGRLAYLNYKKENGGLKKSRKKAAAKKK